MSKRDLFSEEIYSKIDSETVQAVLSGQPFRDINSDKGMCEGSALLNAYSLACRELRKNPGKHLAVEPLPKLRKHGVLGRFFINLVNQSITRTSTSKPAFTDRRGIRQVDACYESEGNFLLALGHNGRSFMRSSGNFTRLYYDKHERLTFVEKGMKAPASINIQPITLNNIRHPAGTLFNLATYCKEDPVRLNDNIQMLPLGNIVNIVPLRLSAFAFDPQERREIFTPPPYPGEERAVYIPETDGLSLGELVSLLPKPELGR